MFQGLTLKAAISFAVITSLMALPSGSRKHKVKPGVVCEVPNYNYRVDKSVGLATAVSRTAIVVESTETTNVPVRNTDGSLSLQSVKNTKRLKYFQLGVPSLVLNHCSISRVVATLDDQQNWGISFRADQNPQPIGAVSVPGDPSRLIQTGHFKRNEFTVRVRYLGSYQSAPENPGLTEGRPVLLGAETISFFVQNGEPLDVQRSGQFRSPLGDAAAFSMIDRIEVDFSYKQ